MKKKILSIALALCMILTMMPMATGVAWAAATSVTVGGVTLNSTTPFYVNGVASANETVDEHSWTAKFEGGTLTLNGLNLTSGNITATGDLTIYLVGDNTLGDDGYGSYAINVTGNLTISGSGELEARSAANNAMTTIYASGSMEINGAKVTAIKAGGAAQAINAKDGNIVITNLATVIAENKGSDAKGYALLAGNIQSGSSLLNNIQVSNGATLTATQSGSGDTKAVKGTIKINEGMTGAINTVKVGESSPGSDWDNSASLDSFKYLNIVAQEYNAVPVPTAPNLTYTGSLQTGVPDGVGYTLSGTKEATDAGNYTAIATLKIGYKWNDGTITPKNIEWSIANAEQAAPSNLDVEAPTTAGGKGKITGTKSEMEYRKDGTSGWTPCYDTATEVDPGDYYVRYKVKTNYNAGAESAKLTVPAYSAPSNPGGSYTPTIQKPTVIADEGAEATLSFYGDKLTIKVAEDYELADVIVNGVSKGKVTELTGLKTGDKVEVKTEKKQEEPKEPTKEEIIAALDNSKLVARSKLVTLKNGKKAVRITWYDENGNEVDFDGVEIYRSTKRYKGYGTKPFYETKGGKTEGYYVNTRDLEEGTTYYYKVRGYVMIDGQKYYTDYSLKAIRTLK